MNGFVNCRCSIVHILVMPLPDVGPFMTKQSFSVCVPSPFSIAKKLSLESVTLEQVFEPLLMNPLSDLNPL